ncbi:MAG TPA: hypothetical protein VJV78_44225 [Polyangiales bacterium]|nr:hypothetical protein [Polyangiales bacterium]
MGLEAKIKVGWQNKTAQVRVHLDSNKLDVYLKPALHVPFSEMRGIEVGNGELRMRVDGSPLVLQLGAAAERWATKIKNPKSVLDKLGVKAGDARVALINFEDPDFEAELLTRVPRLYKKPIADAELVFLRVKTVKDLERLSGLRERLASHGAIWVVREKGKSAPVKEGDVRKAAKGVGLVDLKVVAFSEELTADKYVIPVAAR